MTLDLSGHRTLVTGGAGFIGSHLVDALLAAGAEVRVLDNLATGNRSNLEAQAASIDFQEGDLRDREACAQACEGRDLVFHQAALGSVPRSIDDPATTIAVNVSGTANLYAAARDAGVQRIIYASSSSVYGDSQESPKREGSEGRPLSPYAWSKVMGEQLAASFSDSYELELIGLRYFNVYGPRQSPAGPYAAVVPRFFHALLEDQEPLIYGDGEQSRDFTTVTDAIRANLLGAVAPPSACGRAFNIAGGKPVTVNDLLTTISSVLGVAAKPRHEAPRAGDVRHSLADLTAAREHLRYEPSLDLDQGLALASRYYRGSGEARSERHGD